MNPKSELIFIAERLAKTAHAGHTRSNRANTPYEIHLAEVVELVAIAGGSQEEIAAGWLHDSVEDTSLTLSDIERALGFTVARMVGNLTDLPEYRNLPTLIRKTKQAERALVLPKPIKRVKLSDQISNVRCCKNDPPVRWNAQKIRHYIEGARRVAFACRHVSQYLDDLFEEEYRAAYELRVA